MANFRVHLTTAAGISGIMAITTLYAGLASPTTALLLMAVGTVGGLCPDLDSQRSISQRIGFLLFCGLTVWTLGGWLPTVMTLPETIIILVGGPLVLYFAVLPWLCSFMKHRGNCHSLLTGLLLALALTNTGLYGLGLPLEQSYLLGIFFFVGFISHLLLDELYAISLGEVRLKKSFGTALKPFSARAPFGSTLLGVICLALFLNLPSTAPLKLVVHKLGYVATHISG